MLACWRIEDSLHTNPQIVDATAEVTLGTGWIERSVLTSTQALTFPTFGSILLVGLVGLITIDYFGKLTMKNQLELGLHLTWHQNLAHFHCWQMPSRCDETSGWRSFLITDTSVISTRLLDGCRWVLWLCYIVRSISSLYWSSHLLLWCHRIIIVYYWTGVLWWCIRPLNTCLQYHETQAILT